MKKLLLFLLIVLPISALIGAPVGEPFTIQGDTKADPGKLIRLSVVNAPPKSGIIWDVYPDGKADLEELPGGKLIFTGLPGVYQIKVRAVQVSPDGQVTIVTARSTVTIGGVVPPGPDPPGPVPPPGPVTSFHVFLVFESGATYTQKQVSAFYSTKIDNYLDANCLPGGAKAWRRYDKNNDSINDDATLNALWTAVKPKITTHPCVVIEVNNKAEILPLPESPDALIELFKKYRGQ